jgi:hypothetical protein
MVYFDVYDTFTPSNTIRIQKGSCNFCNKFIYFEAEKAMKCL